MKHSVIISIVMAAATVVVLCSGTLDSNGKLANAGAPGEATCSNAGCHGAGNGSGSSGGLADNAGPGSIALSTTPALTGNTYLPNQTYSMGITVSETGKSLFGFSCEIVDNSGNTNPGVNNTAGVFTITDPVRTRKGQFFGTGRVTVTHTTNGGATPNSATFRFNWTAPASGTVNVYYDGIAANMDGLSDAGDNVYAKSVKLTPMSTGIAEYSLINTISVFPNPADAFFIVSFNKEATSEVRANILDAGGRMIRQCFAGPYDPGMNSEQVDVRGLADGVYILELSGTGFRETRQILISH